MASDFGTTFVARNDGQGRFLDVTDKSVINDENGMGSVLGDFRNAGVLDWFVTAVYSPGVALGNWGTHGNRMYRNDSTPGHVTFTDITDKANVRNGYWGWGACAADFNNDGWLDILEVDGFGYSPPMSNLTVSEQFVVDQMGSLLAGFNTKPARLFINNGDGTFTEEATNWHIDTPMNGRGLACFDYDRDGDVDVAVLDHSKGIKFFENHSGAGVGRHFLSIRLVGNPPNTDALGAKVYVTADLNGNGMIDSNETQLRVAMANSNFNSQAAPDLHFGVGSATSASQIRIIWPDGTMQSFANVPANQFLVYHQP